MARQRLNDAFPTNGALAAPHSVAVTGAGVTLDVASNKMRAVLPDNGVAYSSIANDTILVGPFRDGMVELKLTLPGAGAPAGEFDVKLRDQNAADLNNVYASIGFGGTWQSYAFRDGDNLLVGPIGLPTQTAAHQYGIKYIAWGQLIAMRVWDITAAQTEGSAGSSNYHSTGASYLTPGHPKIVFADGDTALTYEADDVIVTSWDAAPYCIADRGSLANVTGAATSVVTITNPTLIVVGNYMFMRIAVDNSGTNGARPGITSIVDSRSNTWTAVAGGLTDPGAANVGVAVYFAYAKVTTAYQAADTITVTWTTGSPPAKAIVVEEWANVHPTSPIAVAAVSNQGTATAVVSIGPITPLGIDQVVYAVLAIEGPNADTIVDDQTTWHGIPYMKLTALGSTDGTATNNQKVYGVAKPLALEQGATISAHTWNPTLGTARDWAGLTVVINAAPRTLVAATPRARRALMRR